MRKTAMAVIAVIMVGVAMLAVGCGVSTTTAENGNFMKTATWGEYVAGNTPKVKFENHTYTVLNKALTSDEVEKRVGVLEKDKSQKLYCWIYTVKNQNQEKQIALYNYNNDGKFMLAEEK